MEAATVPQTIVPSTIVYPGAGMDATFLDIPEFKDVKKFVLCDVAPTKKVFCGCCVAPPSDPAQFFAGLESNFGPVKRRLRRKTVYERDGRTIEYYHNCEWDVMRKHMPPRSAVYLCGLWIYVPKIYRTINACSCGKYPRNNNVLTVHHPYRCRCRVMTRARHRQVTATRKPGVMDLSMDFPYMWSDLQRRPKKKPKKIAV